jgi:hypothetical protein
MVGLGGEYGVAFGNDCIARQHGAWSLISLFVDTL